MDKISLTDGVIQAIIELAPSFILVCFMFIVFSWIRLLIDNMSGRGF